MELITPTEGPTVPQRYWVVAWDQYYPEAGLYNVQHRTYDIQEAFAKFNEHSERYDFAQIVDIFDNNKVLANKDRGW